MAEKQHFVIALAEPEHDRCEEPLWVVLVTEKRISEEDSSDLLGLISRVNLRPLRAFKSKEEAMPLIQRMYTREIEFEEEVSDEDEAR